MAKRIISETEREYQHKYQAAYRQTVKARAAHREHKLKYEAKCPSHKQANHEVERAIRSGLLIRRPCEVCGTTRKIEGHHDDYSQPLSVRWLCERHHKNHHAAMRHLK